MMTYSTKGCGGLAAAAFLLLLAPREGGAQARVEEITAPVSTAFGTYTPLTIPPYRIEVGMSEPTPSADFSNVYTSDDDFSWKKSFSPAEQLLLRKNGFVARAEPFGTFAQAYAESSEGDLPIFVTVDAILHGLRATADESYRQIERDHLAPGLATVLDRLARSISSQLGGETNAPSVRALTGLLAYVQTGQALLDPSISIDSRVAGLVRSEIDKIDAGRSAATAILPAKRIDYGRFIPTGHYALNGTFKNYYRARTWLSEFGFDLRADAGFDPQEGRMAILLARTMESLGSEGDFRGKYLSVSEPIAFFSGRSQQDINWDMLAGAFRGYYGIYGTGSTVARSDSEVVRFVGYLADQLPGGSIRSDARSFRLLSRPGTLGNSLWDRLSSSSSRGSGLALMAAMGAERAGSVRNEELRRLLTNRPSEDWVQDLQWSMLYTVQGIPAREDDSQGYPRFMRSDAWRDRELVSALGAWADFQHETSVIPASGTAAKSASFSGGRSYAEGYVEPDPQAWGRVAAMARYLRSGLDDGDFGALINRRLSDKLRDMENIAAHMMRIAAYELQGTELSTEQEGIIASMPARIAAYETFTDESLRDPGLSITAGAAQGLSGSAPANGHPLAIYVIVPRGDGSGGLMLTRGAVQSYYEVNQPNERWVESITSGRAGTTVQAAPWMTGFTSADRPLAQNSSGFRQISGSIPASTVSYTPTSAERRRALPNVRIDMETNVVRRSNGELWFTVRAPQLNGTDIVIVAVNEAGNIVHRSAPARVERGERYDMIPVDDMKSGQYFVRVVDTFDRTLASGRFLVVR